MRLANVYVLGRFFVLVVLFRVGSCILRLD
jgi:hypothetical protein